jgi:hypothetical protein
VAQLQPRALDLDCDPAALPVVLRVVRDVAEDVLRAQLVEDGLVDRGQLARGARVEDAAARLVGEAVEERAGAGGLAAVRPVLAGEGHGVDDDVARADQLHHLAHRHLARGVVPVGEEHEHLAAGRAGDAREVDRDRVVEGGVALALRLQDAPEDALLVLGAVAREADVPVEEDEEEVAGAGDRLEEADGRLLAELQVPPHALARVEEHAQVQGQLLALPGQGGGGEDLDLLGPAVLPDDEVPEREVGDEPALPVAHGEGDVDEVEPGVEDGGRLGRGRRRGEGQKGEATGHESRHALTSGGHRV